MCISAIRVGVSVRELNPCVQRESDRPRNIRGRHERAPAAQKTSSMATASPSVLRDRTNTAKLARGPKLARDEKSSPVERKLPQVAPHPDRERLESELYENRALLHRVLREKQQFLSRQRTQGSALERALVAQEVLIAELRELDNESSPSGEAEAETEAEARTQPEIERRFEELHLRLRFKEAALQQQRLETRFYEQQVRPWGKPAHACTHTSTRLTRLHMPSCVSTRLHTPPHASSRFFFRATAGRTSPSTARLAASDGSD